MELSPAVAGRLSALSAALECAPLVPEDGRVLFGLDEDMGAAIFLEKDDAMEDVMVACVIIGRPDENDAGLLFDILSANYMWAASGDGTLAIDGSSGLLVAHRAMEKVLTPEGFVDRFASLVGAARYWRARMSAQASGGISPELIGMLRV